MVKPHYVGGKLRQFSLNKVTNSRDVDIPPTGEYWISVACRQIIW